MLTGSSGEASWQLQLTRGLTLASALRGLTTAAGHKQHSAFDKHTSSFSYYNTTLPESLQPEALQHCLNHSSCWLGLAKRASQFD